jgi:hypothetical protein
MYSRPWLAILMALLLIGAVAVVGYYVYQAGLAQGMALGAARGAPEVGAAPWAAFPPYYYARPFGFGLLGCLIPLAFLFLIGGLFRGLFWGRHWGWGQGHGRWWGHRFGPEGADLPPMFREWHRRAHEPEAGTSQGGETQA